MNLTGIHFASPNHPTRHPLLKHRTKRMSAASKHIVTPLDVVRILRDHPRRWIVPMLVAGLWLRFMQ